MRYRNAITETVVHIVRDRMNKTMAVAAVREYAGHYVPIEDQSQFLEAVERDLMSLHEGNIILLLICVLSLLTQLDYQLLATPHSTSLRSVSCGAITLWSLP